MKRRRIDVFCKSEERQANDAAKPMATEPTIRLNSRGMDNEATAITFNAGA
jgi:hypothetical protein